MSPLFDYLQETTILRRFWKELEADPKRTLLVLAAVLLLSGAGAYSAIASTSNKESNLYSFPADPAVYDKAGNLTKLPQATAANNALQATIHEDARNAQILLNELEQMKDKSGLTEAQLSALNKLGQVTY